MGELVDAYNRKINYLRLSVTDRCNLRCLYCMPAEGIRTKKPSEILSYEEMVFFAKVAISAGISRIRLTGGEPLVRRDLVVLVENLAPLKGLKDLSLTTNGILLKKYARSLFKAGLKRINMSLGSLERETYNYLTRGGKLDRALEGLKAALEAGFNSVKINAVILKGINEDLEGFRELVYRYPVHVRFVEFMPFNKDFGLEALVPAVEIKEKLKNFGNLEEVFFIDGAGPATYYRFPKARGTLGFIPAMSQCFCEWCNRLRLTADGYLRACLFSDDEVNVKEALRQGAGEKEIKNLILKALAQKPKDYRSAPKKYFERTMAQIGG